MSFSYKFGTLLHKSDGSLSKIDSDNGLKIYNFDKKLNLKSSSLISSDNLSFIDYYFDINNNDKIYGLVSHEKKELSYIYINDKIVFKKSIFGITTQNEFIKFPYIKLINKQFHIFYFLINTQLLNCRLIHKYHSNNSWTTTEVDCFNFKILTNFSIIYEDNNINVFYFKLVKDSEELFMCSFNMADSSWSKPYQITHTGNKKIYLSVIRDSTKNTYHITYSEDINNQYCCTYINGYTKDNTFVLSNSLLIQKSVACLFPNIIKYNDLLNIQWLEFKSLYSSISNNLGDSWSKKSVDITSVDTPFSLYFYKSNYANDFKNIFSSAFTCEDSFKILGIRYAYF